MENAYILCNVIDSFIQRKITKTERGRPFGLLKFQMALAYSKKFGNKKL
jgi:hypothetical protein